MPQIGPVNIPSAADAEFPNFVGQTVTDSVVPVNYVPQIATARDVPYKVQNEILAHQAVLVQQAVNISLVNAATAIALSSLYTWQACQ